ESIGDAARTQHAGAFEHAGVGAEGGFVVSGAGPGAGGVQSGDGGVAVRIAQRAQDGNQGCYRVRGRSAVLARVQFTGGGLHLHVHVHHSTQSGGQGGLSHPHVAGVLDEDRIGGEFLRVLLHVLLQPGGALLLGSFDHHGERDGDLSGGQQGAQCGQMGDDAAFAVGGAAAVVATLVLGQGERIGAPVAGVGGGLDV